MFNIITNHYLQATQRLMSQYQGSQNLLNFLAAIIQPIQDIEYELNDMNVERELVNAFGIQLDNIGTIVGLARSPGQTDSEYLMELQGQIGINVSEGQPESVIQAFQLFTGVPLVILDEFFPAEIVLESIYVFANQAAVDAMIQLMQEVAPAGVRCDGIITFDPVMPFAFDGSLFGSGFDDGSNTVGGIWSSLNLPDTQFSMDGDDVTGAGFGSTDDPLVGGWFIPYDLPPTFFNAMVLSAGTSVKVSLMGVAQAPLIPETGVSGFTVLVNSAPATISSSSIEYNSKILLEISSPLIHSTDTVTVAYTPGNLTDSDGNALAAFSAQFVINDSTI